MLLYRRIKRIPKRAICEVGHLPKDSILDMASTNTTQHLIIIFLKKILSKLGIIKETTSHLMMKDGTLSQ